MADGTFDAGYRRWRDSSVHAEIFGDGLPPEIAPFSFVPMSRLRELAQLLHLERGHRLGRDPSETTPHPRISRAA